MVASVGTVGTAATVATAASEVASTVALVDSEVLQALVVEGVRRAPARQRSSRSVHEGVA